MPVTLALAPQQPLSGTRAGSLIEITNKFVDSGLNNLSTSIPIPRSAKPNDFMACWFFSGGNAGITAAGLSSDLMLIEAGTPILGIGTNNTRVHLLHYTVKEKDPGSKINITWNYAGGQASFCLICYSFRYVDLQAQFDAVGTPWVSAGDGPGQFAGTNLIVPNAGDLVFSAAGTAALNQNGTTIQDVAAWYESTMVGGAVPSLAGIAGVVDLGYAYTWNGPEVLTRQGAGGVSGSGAGLSVSIKAIPAPSGGELVYTFSPTGAGIDAAGLSGSPPTVTLVYAPTHGQGSLEAWLLAREQHTTGAFASYWNASENVWQATEVWNFGALSSYSFPPGAFVNDGTQWDLYGAVQESARGLRSSLALIATFYAWAPPALIATGPTGTPTSAQPVTWANLASAATPAQPNLIPAADSGFETTSTAWFPIGGAFQSQSTQWAHSGKYSMRFTSTGSAGPGINNYTPSAFPVTPTQSYILSAVGHALTTPQSMTLGVNWLNASGGVISSSTAATATDSTALAGVTFSGTVGPAPAGSVKGQVFYKATGTPPNGDVHFVDDFKLSAAPPTLTAFRVLIFSSSVIAQDNFDPVHPDLLASAAAADSGVVASTATTWTPSPALRGGAYYTAYVAVRQGTDQWSEWEPVSHFADYATCAAPTWTVAAGADPVTGCPRAVVNVTGHDPNTLTGTTFVDLFRLSPDGTTWIPVPDAQDVAVPWPGQVLTLYDNAPPPNTPVTYWPRIYSTSPTGP